jgi:N-acetylmuramoyl-L-alanine amidase
MFRYFRAASIAAASFVAILGAGYAGPSQAWELTEAPLTPAFTVQNVGIVPEATPAPAAADAVEPMVRRSLAELVAAHSSAQTADAQQECLAGAVYFEAKGEPLNGQLSVAEVILNRARSGRFPASICGVVKQRGQFSFVRGGRFPAIARASLAWKRAVAIAHIAREQLADGAAPRALFFHARYVSPRWKLTRVAAVGNHIFYR